MPQLMIEGQGKLPGKQASDSTPGELKSSNIKIKYT